MNNETLHLDGGTVPIEVKNPGFLLDRMGKDCHPVQFLRELTQNAIEAIQKTNSPGKILWDVDWNYFDLKNFKKLCIVDTGIGMTGPEMVELINKLSSSGSDQTMTGNYGVGAKIAAATRNHHGVIYLSWKDGRGTMIHLWRNSRDGTYGLKRMQRKDGSFREFLEIDDALKPTVIDQHGTMVLLLGNREEEDTIQPPTGTPAASRWIAKYLNTRYYRLPSHVTLQAREGWDYPREDTARNKMRTITGQEPYLKKKCQTSGIVELTSCVAHWWILQDSRSLTQDDNYYASAGHVAALYQDELYELVAGRGAAARLQQFGVVLGHRRVVIYTEPNGGVSKDLTTNTARTLLLLNNEPLPWDDWAEEFRAKMPDEIKKHIEDTAAGSLLKDHSTSVKERLKAILDMYRVSRYRPSELGDRLIDDEQSTRGGRPGHNYNNGVGGRSAGGSHRRTGTSGNIYTLFERSDGVPGVSVNPDPFPTPMWKTVKDGTREPDEMEDRAARYIRDQNLLMINGDFRVFTDMTDRWVKEFGQNETLRQSIDDVVRSWFEQALIETVLGIQALEGAKEWTHQAIEKALSEEALTSAVMQRYHVFYSIKRDLSSKLGKLSLEVVSER